MKRILKNKRREILAIFLIAAMAMPSTLPVWGSAVKTGETFFEDSEGRSDEEIMGLLEDGKKQGVKRKAKRNLTGQNRIATSSNGEIKEKHKKNKLFAATESEAEIFCATVSNARMAMKTASTLGDIWDGWAGDFSFLDGSSGNGSQKKPYQIKNKNQLMGFSYLVAMGMRVQPGEGSNEIVGSYEGKYFELVSNIDLGGMDWNPIGFYQDSSELSGEVIHKFCGHFNGNGKTVSNFKINHSNWPNAGFFGAIEDASIEGIILKPGKTIHGKNNIGILAGSMVDSVIRNCEVSGNVSTEGIAGGVAGELSGSDSSVSIIENCQANVTIDGNGGSAIYIGGIAGKAAGSSIVDCRVETGDNHTARIQGKGVVGGITGFQNDTDIYNCYVSGTIGGTGSKAIGGVTGQYVSGHLKVTRFEGTIGQSNLGTAGRRGSFIGSREPGCYFRYGQDVAYLFSDKESTIAYGICGSGIPDDNEYTYAAHIGYFHKGDLHYSLIQGGISKYIDDRYFYEELEDGILSIIEEDHGGQDRGATGYEIDHFAPNDVGRPVRGYLITVPQIDTVSSGTNYYDVAVLQVRGNSAYHQVIDKEQRGAIAPGRTVIVNTSPNQTGEAKFQMEGVPTYTKGGEEKKASYIKGGEYTFTMPAENTEVKAVYRKVAVKVATDPASYQISVIEERTGNRKSPEKTTRVLDSDGKLIATYINGRLEQGTQIQPVQIQAIVDTNNDVADHSVKWSVDDPELISLYRNDDEDPDGYTQKRAAIAVNLNSSFFTETIRKLEKEQKENNYRYPIPDTIYGAGHQNGGVAVLTAATRPAASFEEKPCAANCRINITFRIKDKTYVANEAVVLDKSKLNFIVTRKLAGNRKTPEESISVTPLQTLKASFQPDYFDKKDIRWTIDDPDLLILEGENKIASVSVNKEGKWMKDIVAADREQHLNTPYEKQQGSGRQKATIRVIADDMLGNKQETGCEAGIQFITKDETEIFAEGVTVKPEALTYDLSCIKTGFRTRPVVSYHGNHIESLTASVFPEQACYKKVIWQVSDDAIIIDPSGKIMANFNAEWIEKVKKTYPYSGSHLSTVTAVTEDGGFQSTCKVRLNFNISDQTCSGGSSGGGGSSSNGRGSGSGGRQAGSFHKGDGEENSLSGDGPAAMMAERVNGITGSWHNTEDGNWTFMADGRVFREEWAYIHNPYANSSQRNADWFYFDKNSHMHTGWLHDKDGKSYYLHPYSDGTLGHMYTGWKWIPEMEGKLKCYFFNQESDGSKGALLQNCQTPDGNWVNENGEWILNGIVQFNLPLAH